MCLSVPARVVTVHDAHWATVEVGGTSKRISLDLVDDVQAGDYVLLHVGFAIQKLDADEAQKTLDLFDALVAADGGEIDWAVLDALTADPPAPP